MSIIDFRKQHMEHERPSEPLRIGDVTCSIDERLELPAAHLILVYIKARDFAFPDRTLVVLPVRIRSRRAREKGACWDARHVFCLLVFFISILLHLPDFPRSSRRGAAAFIFFHA